MSVQGIDVSSHQSSVDWSQVLQAGKVFAFVRDLDVFQGNLEELRSL